MRCVFLLQEGDPTFAVFRVDIHGCYSGGVIGVLMGLIARLPLSVLAVSVVSEFCFERCVVLVYKGLDTGQ